MMGEKLKKERLVRARIIFLGVLLSVVIIIIKIGYIQFVQGAYWNNIAQVAQLEYKPIPAIRGNIYTDDGSLLATSLPKYRVAMDPTVVSNEDFEKGIDRLAVLLSAFYDNSSDASNIEKYRNRIQKARKEHKKYFILHPKSISYDERKEMEQWPIFKNGRNQGGVIFEKKEVRVFPFNELAKRTIGYIKHNEAGVGLEKAFNQALRGTPGRGLYQKVIGANWKEVVTENKIMPIHGYDIETAIDVNLQDIAQSSLLKVLQNSSAQFGSVIIMEVSTGYIKAIANLSRRSDGTYQEDYNYALGHAAEPGSIFKLVSMLALLEETDVKLEDKLDTGRGEFAFHDCIMRDVKKGGYGILTVQEIFEKSSNIGISRLVNNAFGSCPTKFIKYMCNLGLGGKLKFQIEGAAVPYFISPQSREWSAVSLPWLSIGYNIRVTPLQMLCIYNAVANNGKMMQPIIVKSIKHAYEQIETFVPIVLNEKICTDTTLQKLKIILQGSVERGNSRGIRHSFYKMAGKTGTAHKVKNGKYIDALATSFIGYFPADQPRYSCLVFIDSAQGSQYHFASESAAPVFKDIVDRIAGKDLVIGVPIQDQMPKISSKDSIPLIHAGNSEELAYLCMKLNILQQNHVKNQLVQATVKNNQVCWVPYDNGDRKQVPNVIGMGLQDALFLLENRGLHVIRKGPLHGAVSKQSLQPHSILKLNESSTIILYLK